MKHCLLSFYTKKDKSSKQNSKSTPGCRALNTCTRSRQTDKDQRKTNRQKQGDSEIERYNIHAEKRRDRKETKGVKRMRVREREFHLVVTYNARATDHSILLLKKKKVCAE